MSQFPFVSRSPAQNSEELLTRFAEGDDSALGRLLDREAPRIVGRMRARLPGDVRARLGGSDIMQLTALELIRMRERFDNRGVGAFRELVATIADHALSKAVVRERAQKRTPLRERPQMPTGSDESSGRMPAAVDTHTPSRDADRKESVDHLQACLEELMEADRSILRMIDYEDQSYAEVAEELGLSSAAVQKRHSRAVIRLRNLMKRERG
jgi:RNA polymerase sigma factor (sigma-70 family)